MDVSEIIARLRAQGDVVNGFDSFSDPKPLDTASLAQLRLPSGDPIPDDLATWLAYDASWLGLLNNGGQLEQKTLRTWLIELRQLLGEVYTDEDEELREWIAEETGDESVSDEQLLAWWIEQLPSPDLADVFVVRLPSGDQDNLLMLESGRKSLRVLGFHKFIEFWWKYESFADYLAHWFRFEKR